jgi:hypothetical protein
MRTEPGKKVDRNSKLVYRHEDEADLKGLSHEIEIG